jgi:hypothetical protein
MAFFCDGLQAMAGKNKKWKENEKCWAHHYENLLNSIYNKLFFLEKTIFFSLSDGTESVTQ